MAVSKSNGKMCFGARRKVAWVWETVSLGA